MKTVYYISVESTAKEYSLIEELIKEAMVTRFVKISSDEHVDFYIGSDDFEKVWHKVLASIETGKNKDVCNISNIDYDILDEDDEFAELITKAIK